jgi:uncharacterized protein
VAHAVVHFEICGPDETQLSGFYASLFGWRVRPVPGLPHVLIDTCGGAGINGSLARSPDGDASLVFYIQADELQAILDKVNLLGGKTAAPISDLDRIATLAKFEDPDGLVVGLVLGPADPGPARDRQPPTAGAAGQLVSAAALPATGAPGQAAIPGPSAGQGAPVDWFELLGSDAASSQRFYAEIFGWHVTSGSGSYGTVDTGSARGIPGGVGGGEHQWATVYARVADVAATLARAQELGGGTERGPQTFQDGMTAGALRDPAGNVFGVYSRS